MSSTGTQLSKQFIHSIIKNKRSTIIGAALLVTGIIGSCFIFISRNKNKNKLKIWDESSKNKVILHTVHSPSWTIGTPNASPFVSKLICYLSINKIPYTVDGKIPIHPVTKKTPWITHKGKHIQDSQLCIEYLNKEFNIDMNSHLTNEQKALAMAYRIMIEDGLYWNTLYRRWIDTDANGEENLLPYLYAMMGKSFIVKMVAKTIQKHVKKMCYDQGISRYDINVVYKRGTALIESVLTYLGNKKYFFGDTISEIDVVVYGFLSSMYSVPFLWKNDTQSLPKKHIVSQYIKRMEKQAFGMVKYWKDN